MWGLVLAEFGASRVLANIFFAAALLLLAFWKPGAIPVEIPTD
jgi:hypothetical protein